MNAHGQTISLCMIVKNEAPVIRRCLDSVRPLIDTWFVVDTGSTDGTQEIIREHLRGLPGELVERQWVNFAHNRSEALALAKGHAEYIFIIDADETLHWAPDFTLPRLTADSYEVEVRHGGMTFLRKALVRDALEWQYRGVLHEYIFCKDARTDEFLPGLTTVPHPDGARARDPNTYRRDALTLEKALLDEPDNSRHVFYLAQSYRDAGDADLALRHYGRRVGMGGWAEEVFYSLYQIAQIKERLGRSWGEVMEDYLSAYSASPDRAGPLYRIGMHYQSRGQHAVSHLFLKRAVRIPPPGPERLFVERWLYDWLVPLEYAVACYYVGDHASAIATNNRLLASAELPAHMVDQVIRNRRFSLGALHPPGTSTPGPLTVVVTPGDPGPELDDLVESLERQTTPFVALFADDGSAVDLGSRLPLGDPRFGVVRLPESMGTDACVVRVASERTDPLGIVLWLAPPDRLAVDTLAAVHAAFSDPACDLAYGQYRLPDGRLGRAEPAPSQAAFEERGAALAARSPIAFRRRLLDETSAAPGGPLRARLWLKAGFSGARFLDTVLTVADSRPVPEPRRDLDRSRGLPRMSCLLVTRDRLALTKRAIRSFAAQTYPNRELVIVTTGPRRFREALERYADALGSCEIRIVAVNEPASCLGRLRNLALDAAEGQVVCRWDDDGCSHPDRLSAQAEALLRSEARACLMTDYLCFHETDRVMRWLDATLGEPNGPEQLRPRTLMAFGDARIRFIEDNPSGEQSDDFTVGGAPSEEVASLAKVGHLYMCLERHASKEHLQGLALSASDLCEREALIRAASRHYSVPRPFAVLGSDGPAFTLNE